MKRFSGVLLILGLLVLTACGDATATTAPSITTAAATTAPATTAAAVTTSTASTTAASGGTTAAASGGVTTAAGTTAASGSRTTAAAGPTTAAGASTPSTPASTASDLGLPIYSGLKPLSLGQTFEQALAQGFTGQAGLNAKYGVFSTSDTPDKLFTYYDSEMQKAGFTKATEQTVPSTSGVNLTGKLTAYQKGSGTGATGAVVLLLGPLDANTVALFTAQSPSAAQQLKPNDSIVFIFNNLSGAALQLPESTPGSNTTTGTSGGAAPAGTPTK